jgi:hypothetical protein
MCSRYSNILAYLNRYGIVIGYILDRYSSNSYFTDEVGLCKEIRSYYVNLNLDWFSFLCRINNTYGLSGDNGYLTIRGGGVVCNNGCSRRASVLPVDAPEPTSEPNNDPLESDRGHDNERHV